jgi:hypothetical protein
MDGYIHWLLYSDQGPIVLVTIVNVIFWGPTLVAAYVVLRRAGLSGWWTPLFFLYPFSLWFLALRKWPALRPKSN